MPKIRKSQTVDFKKTTKNPSAEAVTYTAAGQIFFLNMVRNFTCTCLLILEKNGKSLKGSNSIRFCNRYINHKNSNCLLEVKGQISWIKSRMYALLSLYRWENSGKIQITSTFDRFEVTKFHIYLLLSTAWIKKEIYVSTLF